MNRAFFSHGADPVKVKLGVFEGRRQDEMVDGLSDVCFPESCARAEGPHSALLGWQDAVEVLEGRW